MSYSAARGNSSRSLRDGPSRITRPPIERLTPEDVACDEHQVGRALGHPARQVGIPLRAEGNVDADVIALARQLFLQVTADAIEHLELEARARDVVRLGVTDGLTDDMLVVSGDGGIGAMFEQFV